MYVNTLITLQENLTTYAVEGKKVTGHVTINSPGMIKCYVQNLKGQETGKQYTFFAFSKTKNKGVKIGTLSKQKESKWIVDEKNVKASGIKLEELDAVAIVSENDMRGADTVAMGFKNNRYIIIPLIDDLIKVVPNKEGYKAKEYNGVLSTNTNTSSSTNINTSSNTNVNTNSNSNVVSPDPILTGNSPVQKGKVANQAKIQNNASQTSSMHNTMSTANKPSSTNISYQTIANTDSGSNIAGNINTNASSNNMENASINAGSNTMWNTNTGSDTVGDANTNAGSNISGSTNTEAGCNCAENASSTGYNNMPNYAMQPSTNSGQTIEYDNVQKKSLLDNVQEAASTEGLEENESELVKIAQALQEVEKDPAIVKSNSSGMNYASSSSTSNASVVRESENYESELDEINKRTAVELAEIINRLKQDETIKAQIEKIEKEVEKISYSGKDFRKSNIEKQLETRYLSKQQNSTENINMAYEIQEEEEQVQSFDTTPRKAINFIEEHLKIEEKECETEKLLSHQSYQEEIDYISEIDKKIREIEEKRKQEQ